VRTLPHPQSLLLIGLTEMSLKSFRSAEPLERHPNIEIRFNVVIDDPEEVVQSQAPAALLGAK
jgi:hypothetical protein